MHHVLLYLRLIKQALSLVIVTCLKRVRRIESTINQHAYGNSSFVTRLAENLDDDSKTVLNTLLRVAPQLSQLDALVELKQGGRHNNTIAKDLAQAA